MNDLPLKFLNAVDEYSRLCWRFELASAAGLLS
jgi:hypothetical protein